MKESTMELSSVPVGEKAVITDTSYIKVTFERTSESSGIIEQFEPSTGKLVLRTTFPINGSRIDILYADPTFWTFKVDGSPTTLPLSMQYLQVDIDPKSRTVNFKTK
jgi:hypothetical protein